MHARNLRYFKKTLSDQLQELSHREKQTVEELQGSGDRVPDSIDQAMNEAGISFRLRIRDRELQLMGKIREALARIEEGTFGICDRCGEEISLKRLRARPVANFCIACKSRLEARERAVDSAPRTPQAFLRAAYTERTAAHA